MPVDWPVLWLVKHGSVIIDIRHLYLDSGEGGEWRGASITSFNNYIDWWTFWVKLGSVVDEQGSWIKNGESNTIRLSLSKGNELQISFFWNWSFVLSGMTNHGYHCWGQCRNLPVLMTSLCRWSFHSLLSLCQLLLLWQLHFLVVCAQAELPCEQIYLDLNTRTKATKNCTNTVITPAPLSHCEGPRH